MSARILIVDDDVILSGLLQLTLELEGFEVVVANDGAAGLECVDKNRFDLVVLDLVMPKIDGIKFLRLLAEKGAERPPIMVVSSAANDSQPDQFRALGVVDNARKPVEPAELVSRVKRAISGGFSRETAATSDASATG